jgi:O-6-methylguanine DNA methyltransferase
MGMTGQGPRLPWDVPVELVVRPAPPSRRGEGLELRVLSVVLDPAVATDRALICARPEGSARAAAAPRPLLVAVTRIDGRDVLAGIVRDIEELAEAWPAARIVPALSRSGQAGQTLAATLQRLGSPLPVLVAGTALRVAVLTALAGVPLGARISYAQLAARAGASRAVRAAARVMSTNVVPLVLPCHRVVPSSGGIGRYGWGAEVKQHLLDLEDAHVQQDAPAHAHVARAITGAA